MNRCNKIKLLFLSVAVGMFCVVMCSNSLAAVHGNVDNDSSVTASDARLVLRAVVGLDTLSREQKIAADTDGDGVVTSSDARCILRIAVGIETIIAHSYSDYTVINSPSCTASGSKVRTCSYCGGCDYLYLPALGHSYKTTVVPPGDTSVGYTLCECTVCKTTYKTDFTAAKRETATENGKIVYLGQSEADVIALFGAPARKDSTYQGISLYVYNSSSRIFIGIKGGRVVMFHLMSDNFTFDGHKSGDSFAAFRSALVTGNAAYYTDSNNGNILYAVTVVSSDITLTPNTSFANYYTEVSYELADLTNAFRAQNGTSALTWHTAVASVATAHSSDMAVNNYFGHINLKGKTAGDRASAAALNYSRYGENIAAGLPDAISTMNLFVNSNGHRSNMLKDSYTYIGVGVAYSASSEYHYYWTQNFYQPMN